MFKRIKNLEQALRMMIEADIKYKKNNIEIQGKIDDSFHNRLLKLEDNSFNSISIFRSSRIKKSTTQSERKYNAFNGVF